MILSRHFLKPFQLRHFSTKQDKHLFTGQDPYEILGVTRIHSSQDVKEAFRKLAQLHHPDTNKDGDHQKFVIIKHAYDEIMLELDGPQYKASDTSTPADPVQTKQDLEKQMHMERIRAKIEQEMERKRAEQRVKDQEEDRKRGEMERAREEYRQRELQKHLNMMRVVREQQQEQYAKVVERQSQKQRRMGAGMMGGQAGGEYDSKQAQQKFDQQAMLHSAEQIRHTAPQIDPKDVNSREQEVGRIREEKERQVEAERVRYIEEISIGSEEMIQKSLLKSTLSQQRQNSTSENSNNGAAALIGLGLLGVGGLLVGYQKSRGQDIDQPKPLQVTYPSQSKNDREPSKVQQAEVSEVILNSQQDLLQTEDDNDDYDEESEEEEEDFTLPQGTDYSQLKTIVLIPFEPAPQDPLWMTKKHAGKRLTLDEFTQYAQFMYDRELSQLKSRLPRAPNKQTFVRLMDEYHIKKRECLQSHSCAGMNSQVFDGVFDRCGKMNPFELWSRAVNQATYDADLDLFMNHYDLPAFQGPAQAQRTLNAFFQAKYGMFYCYDNNKLYGLIDYDPSLIQRWERNEKNLRRTWNLAILSSINEKDITYDDLEVYRKKDFRQSKLWKKYLKRRGY